MANHRTLALYALVYFTLLWLTGCTQVGAARTSRRGQGSSRSRPQQRPRLWKQPWDSRKPNIVLILTDDQDLLLGSMSAMNKTQMVLGSNGANFINAFVTTPLCCPSRSSILTGQYVHNHKVYSNTEHCGAKEWREGPEARSFATYLRNADYRTGYFGKYLNNYNGSYVPPGWTEWVGLLQNSKYYNYTLSRNGQFYEHGFNYYRDYLPDLIANDSITFFKMSKRTYPDSPVAMVMSFPSPHGPEDGAPQYQGMFEGNRQHRTETWNYTDNNDKHWLLRYPNPLTDQAIYFTDILQRKRLITLVSVDDAIAKLCAELSDLGELDNTYIIFTSDHGYHLGQYAMPKGKSLPYDFDIRVPFYMRGPKIPAGIQVPNIVLNIDLAPTILDIAGVDVPPNMDGVSILKLFNPSSKYKITGKSHKRRWRYVGDEAWRTSFLVEKTRSPEDLARLQKRLFQLRGEKEDRLKVQCETPELQSPCQPFQDKECVNDEISGELKIRKCRRPPKLRCRCIRPPSSTPTDPKGRRFRLHERPASQAALTREEKRQQRDFIREHVSQASPPFRFMRNKRDSRTNPDPAVFTLEEPNDRQVEENLLIDPKCQVFKNETVLCDNEIFESRKAWINHRKLISARVRLLRKHLDDLIEIKEFLKDTNPYGLEQPVEEVEVPRAERREKPSKVCNCDNIEGEITEEEARKLEDMGHIYVERGESDVPATPRGSRTTRSLPAFGQVSESNTLLSVEGLSRRQRKIQYKQVCSVEGMKCTSHDNDHWRVPPLWTMGHMCMCLNSVNNTYQCLRLLNSTHNFLYCEFVTNFMEYFDMRPDHDPHQKVNAITDITDDYRRSMRDKLHDLKYCSGARNCTDVQPKPSSRRKTVASGRNSTRGENSTSPSLPSGIPTTPVTTSTLAASNRLVRPPTLHSSEVPPLPTSHTSPPSPTHPNPAVRPASTISTSQQITTPRTSPRDTTSSVRLPESSTTPQTATATGMLFTLLTSDSSSATFDPTTDLPNKKPLTESTTEFLSALTTQVNESVPEILSSQTTQNYGSLDGLPEFGSGIEGSDAVFFTTADTFSEEVPATSETIVVHVSTEIPAHLSVIKAETTDEPELLPSSTKPLTLPDQLTQLMSTDTSSLTKNPADTDQSLHTIKDVEALESSGDNTLPSTSTLTMFQSDEDMSLSWSATTEADARPSTETSSTVSHISRRPQLPMATASAGPTHPEDQSQRSHPTTATPSSTPLIEEITMASSSEKPAVSEELTSPANPQVMDVHPTMMPTTKTGSGLPDENANTAAPSSIRHDLSDHPESKLNDGDVSTVDTGTDMMLTSREYSTATDTSPKPYTASASKAIEIDSKPSRDPLVQILDEHDAADHSQEQVSWTTAKKGLRDVTDLPEYGAMSQTQEPEARPVFRLSDDATKTKTQTKTPDVIDKTDKNTLKDRGREFVVILEEL